MQKKIKKIQKYKMFTLIINVHSLHFFSLRNDLCERLQRTNRHTHSHAHTHADTHTNTHTHIYIYIYIYQTINDNN